LENAAEDYIYSFRKLHEFGDYIVLNVSSPNTPGLRELQAQQALADLLTAVQSENGSARKPILVKIAPDLSPEELEEIIAVCEGSGVAGLIATNTTLDHATIPPERDQTGGLSGVPLREKATEFVRAIRARTTLPIVAVGGINDAASAREQLAAGATLLQVYTGYIYRGPALLTELTGALERR
ncbi:MAG: dihydroorotate dehydrogenase (quinone), partial [Verrucomicrobiaceae bacterium]|nr:dihydroorotate dehydrogenase (quinone) [Verrucomicrobiaceae bacterium]